MGDHRNRYDFANGIGLPLARSSCLTLVALASSITASIWLQRPNLFWLFMLAWIAVFAVLEMRRKREREDEDEAMRRFLGIGDA